MRPPTFKVLSLSLKLLSAFVICNLLIEHSLWASQKLPSMTDQGSYEAVVKPLDGKEKELFKFKRESSLQKKQNARRNKSGSQQLVATRVFTDLEGKVVAKESVYYQEGKLKAVELEQLQLKESGNLLVEENKVIFQYTKDGKVKQDVEELDDALVTSDMIHPFLLANWELLEKGEDLKIRFPVLDRRETVGFKFFKDESETKKRGKGVTVIKMKPSSIIIAALVKPLLFIYDKDKKLLEVQGRTVPKVKDGDKWKDLDARLVFK